MENFGSMDEVFDFAIKNEEESYNFYMGLAGRMDNDAMRQVFRDFAKEEQGHKQKLISAREGNFDLLGTAKKVPDLKIGDYLVDVSEEEMEDMDYQKALVVAMKKEKAAFKLYTHLADISTDGKLVELFLNLAQEEAKHKLRFEIEYDENVLEWN